MHWCVVALLTLVLAGCGQAHDAKSKVSDFMSDNMTLDDYDIVGWTELKTTHLVSDSMIRVMHSRAEAEGLVKPGTPYAARTPRLKFIQVRYALRGDTLRRTFYLDEPVSGVVSFKEN